MALILLKIRLASSKKRHNLAKIKVFRKIWFHYTFSSQMSKVQKKVQNSKFLLSNESIEKLRLKNKILQWTEKGRKYLKCRRDESSSSETNGRCGPPWGRGAWWAWQVKLVFMELNHIGIAFISPEISFHSFISNKWRMRLVYYFTHFDSVAYYCCLISHKSLTVFLVSRKRNFMKRTLLE